MSDIDNRKCRHIEFCHHCRGLVKFALAVVSEIATLEIQSLPTVAHTDYDTLPRAAAIYFVVMDGSVVYVGQTQNLLIRWRTHVGRFRGMTFSIAYLLTKHGAQRRLLMERAAISRFEPRLNGVLTTLPRTKRKEFGAKI